MERVVNFLKFQIGTGRTGSGRSCRVRMGGGGGAGKKALSNPLFFVSFLQVVHEL